jgi:HEAT repeat protein/beta-lactamase regulating signal transducer with metallopeptidase domain
MDLTWLPDAAWRGALLLSIAFLVARLLRTQAAAIRHVLWASVLGAVVAMPLLAIIAPLTVPVTVPMRVAELSTARLTPRAESAPVPSDHTGQDASSPAVDPSALLASDRAATLTESTSGETAWHERMSPVGWAVTIWLLGVTFLTLRLIAGFVALARMRRRGVESSREVAELAEACATRLGLHDVPRIIVSSRVSMPCTAGWLRPVVLLPDESATWSPERLEVVLLHELSHIRRMDIVPHLLSEVARVVYWFNPLVWLAAARLRAEAERATDDRVVNAGAKPSDYAAHLLDIVRQSRPLWHPAPLMPLARRSEFEGRMLAILESGGTMPSARWALGTVLLVGGLSLGVASMDAAPAAPWEKSVTQGSNEVAEPGDNRVEEQQSDAEGEEETTKPRQPVVQNVERESVVGALAEALRDPVASVRQAAVEALGNTRDSVAVRALMEVLRADESPIVRRSAAWSLGQIKDDLAIPALSEALARDRDVEVRKNAASALGSIDNPRATPALTQALERDADASVRMEAAESLANIEDPASGDALIRALDRDDDPGVRRAVIEAIDNIENLRAVPAVSRALRDADPEVRRAAADALSSMDDKDAVPALIAAARDSDSEVRRAVIEALGSLSDRRSVATLTTALSDTDVDVRRAAASAFGSIDRLRVAPPELIRAMDDRDADVRHQVAHALGHIEDPASLRALIAHVTDANVEVRQAVVESLDNFDDPSVTAALRTALKDTNADVRESAAKALGNRNKR